SLIFAESMFPDRSDFDYDYETLRTTGLILAIVMFVSGILIALSKLKILFFTMMQMFWNNIFGDQHLPSVTFLCTNEEL
uniref:FXYD domain-containing ion transport regulator n=1 Tax=Periophthalmus magnuspinnatus TaxID=409849 RepID=A0A3B3ZLZ7_9GOBI